jgi:hypothetical protein
MENTLGDEPYKKGGEVLSETDNPENYQKRSAKGDDFKSAVADAFSKTPISRLFVILSMVVYAVIAYSKKDKGVELNDLSMFLFFSIFIVLVFIFLAVASHVYRRYLKFFLIDDIGKDVIKYIYNFFSRKSFIVLVIVAIIFSYLFLKTNLLMLFSNIIAKFNSF